MVATSGEGNVILVSLPMIIEDEEVEAVLSAVDHGLTFADRLVGQAVAREPEPVL